jgi:dolichol-phosphate mannosyltransferase
MAFDVSIIIPTYNEKENVAIILPEIFRVMKANGIKGEVIIVDDNSPDGTANVVEEIKKSYDIKLLRRPGKLGLSSAVLDGIKQAEGWIIGVMDADLSHPPDVIPDMIKPIMEKRSDITVGSRYVKDGGVENWPLKRKIISNGAKLLARPMIGLKDPLSGFFFFRRSIIDNRQLSPKGYKIGLEIFIKSGTEKIAEIPYKFYDRKYGRSKLDWKQNVEYLLHLSKLYWYWIIK